MEEHAVRLAMSASSPPQPALSVGLDGLVIGQRVAGQERTQLLGVSGLAKPDQGFSMQLARPLAVDAQRSADRRIEDLGLPS